MRKFSLDNILIDLLKTIGNGPPKTGFNNNTSLKKDLNFDSILIVQLALNISKKFDVDLEDCEIESWNTLGDVYKNLNNLTNNN